MSERTLNRGRVVVSLAALASLIPGLGALYIWRLQTNPAKVAVVADVAPEATPVVRNVTSLGRVEPKGEVITVSGSNGSRISELLVNEGQEVEKEEILAYLEDYGEKLAEKNLAASQLADARMRYDSTTKYSEAQIEEARTRIEQIKTPQSYEVAAQKATVRQLTAESETAKKDYERNQFLVKEGAVSDEVLDEKAANYFSKKAELENAQAQLAQFTETRSRDLRNARHN